MVGAEQRATRCCERPRKYTGEIRDVVRDMAALYYLFVAEACETMGKRKRALAFVEGHL